MKKNILILLILVVVFIFVLEFFGEGLSSRNGALLFSSFAVLWLLGTIIKVYWGPIREFVLSQEDEDISMDEEVEA